MTGSEPGTIRLRRPPSRLPAWRSGKFTCGSRASRRTDAWIGARIPAGGCNRQPAEVMRPTFRMGRALRFVRKAAMGHSQQRAAFAVDEVDLDQARPRRHLLAIVPAKTVGEAVHRHDLAECAPRRMLRPSSADAL